MLVNEVGDVTVCLFLFFSATPHCVLVPRECSANEEARPEHNEQPGQMGHTDPS